MHAESTAISNGSLLCGSGSNLPQNRKDLYNTEQRVAYHWDMRYCLVLSILCED